MMSNRIKIPHSTILLGLVSMALTGCVTSRVEDARVNVTGLDEGGVRRDHGQELPPG